MQLIESQQGHHSSQPLFPVFLGTFVRASPGLVRPKACTMRGTLLKETTTNLQMHNEMQGLGRSHTTEGPKFELHLPQRKRTFVGRSPVLGEFATVDVLPPKSVLAISKQPLCLSPPISECSLGACCMPTHLALGNGLKSLRGGPCPQGASFSVAW